MVKGKSDIQPQRGDICRVNILGKLENGTIVEDVKNFQVQVGDVEVNFFLIFFLFIFLFNCYLIEDCAGVRYGITINAIGRNCRSIY